MPIIKKKSKPIETPLPLISIRRQNWQEELANNFPFTLPFWNYIDTITLTHPVTFLVGENGSGKSTFLETLACSAQMVAVGSSNLDSDPSLSDIRKLARFIKLTWSKKTHRGFYLRAEDFFGFAKRIGQIKSQLKADLEEVDREYDGRSAFSISMAKMAYNSELTSLKNSYGDGLDTQSHGESFLKLFQARFVPNGLYLLDEPEAPLSPLRQLSLLAMIHEMVEQQGQFIIATHSPILMAYPNAKILSFDNGRVTEVPYEELEHVTLTRSFLNDPQSYLRHLWD
jgi:predicted ATPase